MTHHELRNRGKASPPSPRRRSGSSMGAIEAMKRRQGHDLIRSKALKGASFLGFGLDICVSRLFTIESRPLSHPRPYEPPRASLREAQPCALSRHARHRKLPAAETRSGPYRQTPIPGPFRPPGRAGPERRHVAQAQTTVAVPHDWSLKPVSLGLGDSLRLPFIPSASRNFEDYHTHLQNAATNGAMPTSRPTGRSSRRSAAPSRQPPATIPATTGTGVPIYRLNGAKAADGHADFYAGSWDVDRRSWRDGMQDIRAGGAGGARSMTTPTLAVREMKRLPILPTRKIASIFGNDAKLLRLRGTSIARCQCRSCVTGHFHMNGGARHV